MSYSFASVLLFCCWYLHSKLKLQKKKSAAAEEEDRISLRIAGLNYSLE